jgi:hypothetical protein
MVMVIWDKCFLPTPTPKSFKGGNALFLLYLASFLCKSCSYRDQYRQMSSATYQKLSQQATWRLEIWWYHDMRTRLTPSASMECCLPEGGGGCLAKGFSDSTFQSESFNWFGSAHSRQIYGKTSHYDKWTTYPCSSTNPWYTYIVSCLTR